MDKFILSLTVLISGIFVVFFALVVLVFIIKYCGLLISKINVYRRKRKSINSKLNKFPEVEEGISCEIVAAISAAVYCIYGENVKIIGVNKVKCMDSYKYRNSSWGNIGRLENMNFLSKTR